MKLRTKLLLGVGILFLAMIVAMYILPTYFVRRDVDKVAEQIHELILEEHQNLIDSQKLWLQDEHNRIIQNINSILEMLYEEPTFYSSIVFGQDNPLINVWEGITRIAGYDPEIGFVQAHAPKENQTAVALSHTVHFYPVVHITERDGLVLFALHSSENEEGKKLLYVGMPLPATLQTTKGYTLFALLDVAKIAEEKIVIQEEIAKLSPLIISNQLENAKQLVLNQIDQGSPAYHWALKMNLMRILAPLLVEGLIVDQSEKTFIPAGVARMDPNGNGLAILSKDAFSTTPLFDDQLYYETHMPKQEALPLADGFALVTQVRGDHVYFANTIEFGDTFLSIGVPLGHTIKKLALSSNKTVLVQVEKKFWVGFDGDGEKLPIDQINAIVTGGLTDQAQGMVTMENQSFFFSRIGSLDNENLIFYGLSPFEKEGSIIDTLFNLENQLTNRISLQLSLIALGTLALVLLFIGRIGFGIIYPITKLAQATEHVVAGRYEEVVLPQVGKRRDEVAILTHSFGDMVHGLQEREKIRGVLNKVVSKDVADEILRTQIHLGGEDRTATILFSDIRGFSEITENMTPQKTIQMLNSCMTKVSRVIEGEGGVIDKYVGDEVMAIYGAPTTHPDHALRAVSSGMLIVETLKRWNQERIENSEPPMDMGIGIHTGLVVAGNMGTEDRLNYTVLGANVNLAARLCEAAKRNQLIISEATLNQPNVKESFHVKLLEPILLKGFKEPVPIYEVIGFKWET